MSKYIKVKDIKNALIELSKSGKRLERKTTMNIIRALGNLPTIEVSEDCISREYALEVISDYVNYPTEGDKTCAIKNAPSVVPTTEQSSMVGEWIACSEAPDTDRNVFIARGTPQMKSCCIGHYDQDRGLWYEDKNFFASPIYDAMYWCEMPPLPTEQI